MKVGIIRCMQTPAISCAYAMPMKQGDQRSS